MLDRMQLADATDPLGERVRTTKQREFSRKAESGKVEGDRGVSDELSQFIE